MVDPEVLDKIKRACCPQKAIYDIANYVETDIIPPINEATNTANAAAAQANSAYNRATDALNTANGVAADVSRSLIDLNAAGDGSTVTLNAPRNTGNPATAPLPVADATKAGVMNSATYVNLQNLNTRVSSLENQTTTYIVSFTNDNPTQDEINNAYKTAYPTAPFPPIDGTTVIDSTRQLYYRWVKNGAIWLKTTGFVISQWTNNTLGTVKGSTVAGQIQAETDGTGSLVGYDQIKNDITTNATGIQTLTANLGTTNSNVTALTTRVNTNTSNIANAVNTINAVGTGEGASINYVKMSGTQASTALPVVSANQAGIVTPTMFNAWNSGVDYYKYKATVNLLMPGDSQVNTAFSINDYQFRLSMNKTSGSTAISSQILIQGDYQTKMYAVQNQTFLDVSTATPTGNLDGWFGYGFALRQITSAEGSSNSGPTGTRPRKITKVQIISQNLIQADIIFVITSSVREKPYSTSLYIMSNKPITTDIPVQNPNEPAIN